MYRICKEFSFEASHQLHGLPEGHKCARTHGHSYRVFVELCAPTLTPPGFVTDFAELNPLGRYVNIELDHRTLNEVLDVEPTSENLAKHLTDWCLANLPLPDQVSQVAVRVSETASSWAEYTEVRT